MVERRCSCDGRVPPPAWRASDICSQCWRFPWPGSANQIGNDVERWLDGPGIALLTGLPVDDGNPDSAALLAMSIAQRFGEMQPQDWKDNLIYFVRDEGQVTGMEAGLITSRMASSSKSKERLDFHNDAAPRWVSPNPIDYLIVLAVRPALCGGGTILVSARTVWEEISRIDPEASRSLESDFPFNRSGATLPTGEPDFTVGPIFKVDGCFTVRCNRFRIETAARDLGRPLDDGQRRALDLMDSLLARPEFQLRIMLQPGECLLLDDRTVVHARDAFRDAAGQPAGRLQIRAWATRRAERRSRQLNSSGG